MKSFGKRVLSFILILITVMICLSANKSFASSTASENTEKVDNTKKVYDYANLLDSSQETLLYDEVKKYIDQFNMDMVIVTISSNNKSSSMAYADDFYDYNNFGYDAEKSGILFLIDMDNRNMWISTTGKAINIYTDSIIDDILDSAYTYISDGNYYKCAQAFIDSSKSYALKNQKKYEEKHTIPGISKISAEFAVAVTIIYICVGVYTHKKPKKQKEAIKYITKPLELNIKEDKFVDKHVTKSRIETGSSSSGGSTTHESSSGTPHGGGGRRF